MDDWRDGEGDGEGVKRWLLVGAGACVAVVVWMYFARPGDEVLSSSGFDLGSSAAAPSGSSGRIFERRGRKTGLDFVGGEFGEAPSSVRPGDLPGTAAALDVAAAGAASSALAPAASDDGGRSDAASAPPAVPSPDSRDAAESLPKDASGLNRLGAKEGLLSALVTKVMGHPAALRYLLNNKTLVDAYFSRDLVKKNCSSGSALKSYLMNSANPQGVSEELAIARSMLRNPGAVSTALGTEFGKRMMDCPSVGEVTRDPGAAMVIVGSNPALLGMLSDPNVSKIMDANPKAASLLGAAQSGLGAP